MLSYSEHVIEGINSFELTSVNDGHEEVADVCAVFGFEKECIFSMENGLLDNLFTGVMPTPGLCRVA